MSVQFSPETANFLINQAQVKDPSAGLMEKNAERIQQAAEDFEAVFFAEMFKPMFEGLETDEMFGGGKGEEIFRGMMVQEYGKEIARQNITGIQTAVRNAMIEMQAERTEANLSAANDTKRIIDLEILEETQ